MADRTDFHFRQRVTEAELDLAFELLEKADRDIAADLGIFGIISGAVPSEHQPVPDLSIDLTSPTRAYDHLGQRIFFGTDQTVGCSADLVGIPTEVTTPGRERWIGVFLRFERQLSDPRTDGNSQRVYFRRDESFEIVVRQAPEAAVGTASKVVLQDDELLICDVRLEHGQTQIFDSDIDVSRRQAFIFAAGDAVEIESGLWAVLAPAIETAQAALDSVDSVLAGHFDGSAHRHEAQHITSSPHGFIGAATVQDALEELVDDLGASTLGSPGSRRVGADAAPGMPNSLASGTVDQQLSQLLAWLNAHQTALSGAHAASAISANPHNYLTSTTVQAQLQELVDDLQSDHRDVGASQIGDGAIVDSPRSLGAGSVRAQLDELLGHVNDHSTGGDHDERYYNVGELVEDSHRLDGDHASAFARSGHDHDDDYMQQVLQYFNVVPAGETQEAGTLDNQPNLISVGYSYIDAATGYPESTVYARGALTNDIRVWMTKVDMGGGEKDYTVTVRNDSTWELFIVVTAYGYG